MEWQPNPGDIADHATLGRGKIVSVDADSVHVYFRDNQDPDPDNRVKRFRRLGIESYLAPVSGTSDDVLDNLPPWTDGRFKRAKSTITFDDAKAIFRSHFQAGLGDTSFLDRELGYKRSAHSRFLEHEPMLKMAIADRNAGAIAAALDAIYGDSKAPKDTSESRLNLLYPKVEEPAYFDALRNGGDATVRYAGAALDFIANVEAATFDRFAKALEAIPIRSGGATIVHWTTLTWLPFIASPDRHFFVKPTVSMQFASRIAFDVRYRSDLNFVTYAKCVAMAERTRKLLETSELNFGKRPLDLIDVQSFMWVVERYSGNDLMRAPD